MMFAVVAVASFVVAGLTFFSGFGLGTLLMPLFAVFFPVPVAVAATAVLHLANNLFKVAVIGRHASLRIVLRFGLPAMAAAFGGAWLLTGLSSMEPVASWSLAGAVFAIHPVKLTIGALMVLFAVFELTPTLDRYAMPPAFIPLGGILSGFFGGLSGHQGALRTMFLTRAGLDKNTFIATIGVIAAMVDVVRISVYGSRHVTSLAPGSIALVVTASLAAWLGTFTGRRLLRKITMRSVRIVIGVMLLTLGAALAAGIV